MHCWCPWWVLLLIHHIATKSLRRLAAALEVFAKQQGRPMQVNAVSARFADRIPARDLDGQPAEVLATWLQRVAKESHGRKVLLSPLLIGPSSTLTKSMPQAARNANVDVEIAPSLVCLCPAMVSPEAFGTVEIARILADRLAEVPADLGRKEDQRILVCDHGSPVARVSAAREAVRLALAKHLEVDVTSCCMERREGPDYDHCGPLLEEALLALPHGTSARVALLFLQDGRHAGPGGDVAGIVSGVLGKRADLSIETTKVLAGHPTLIELLYQRLDKTVPLRLFP